MRGRIKMAMVSLKYKMKGRGRKMELHKTPKIECLVVVKEWEGKRVLKFKSRVISRVTRQINISKKAIDLDINSIDIIKDVGKTNYDV